MLQPTHRPSCRRPDGAAADAISRSVIKKCLNVTETHNKKKRTHVAEVVVKRGGKEGRWLSFVHNLRIFSVASFPREGVSCSFPTLFLATREERKNRKRQGISSVLICRWLMDENDHLINGFRKIGCCFWGFFGIFFWLFGYKSSVHWQYFEEKGKNSIECVGRSLVDETCFAIFLECVCEIRYGSKQS